MEDIQVDASAPAVPDTPRRRRWSWLVVLIAGVSLATVVLFVLVGLVPRFTC